ncbi:MULTISPECIES: DUF1659 domain-containing protein [Lactobacillus]|uniref:DUF1659 domain-containing protein n=1 Tax=Lactobacillus kullabergensis TaxID=1218493 RepID=A0ABN5LGZ7_9LACO|nr:MULTISPECIES: DUF1659 domain-containing protein [Lactobacillus]AWM75976.1 DUF1659 domain-containing protein [Lactobacillus kullabergensis]RMC52851.1 DUF1659 domain-containing protein [Lactobacillus sp. ESL0261]
MNFALLEQSVQYTFLNSKYSKDGTKSRILKNVREGATAGNLAKVGAALAQLQGDDLGAATLIQRQGIPIGDE